MSQDKSDSLDRTNITVSDLALSHSGEDSDDLGSHASGERDPLDHLAEEFVERCRRGESPSIAEYEARFPDQGEKVRKLLGAVAMMEQMRRGSKQARFMPERIGEFRVLRELGRGGMGVVYEAVQESLWRHVAVKAIHHTQLDMKRLQRFQREAQAVAQLHHTNIVPIFGVGEHDGVPYYAMQYIKGQGLDLLIDSWRKNDSLLTAERWRTAARFASQAAGALDYAHEQGVLHRDIKPANLLIDEHDAVWITDFGLAKMVGHDELTASGDVIGTLRYLAPETLRGISEARGDVYSLGLTLYEMLTLRPPFGDLTPSELLHRVSEGRPVRPREVDSTIPRDLETIVLKATARDLKDRYATAGALARDLDCFLNDRPIHARQITFMERAWRWSRRNRTTAALTALAAVSITLAAVAGWTGYVIENRAGEKQKENLRELKQKETQITRLFLKLFEAVIPNDSLVVDQQVDPLLKGLPKSAEDPQTVRMFADRLDPTGPGPNDGRFGYKSGPGGPGRPGPEPGPDRDDFGPPGEFAGGPPQPPDFAMGPGGPPPRDGPGPGGPPPGDGPGPGGPPPGDAEELEFNPVGSLRKTVVLLENLLASYDRFAQSQKLRTDVELQSEVAWIYYKMAKLHDILGNREQADNAFDRSLTIFSHLPASDPLISKYFYRFLKVCSVINPWQTDPGVRAIVEDRLARMEIALNNFLVAEPNNEKYLRARMQLLAKSGLIRYQNRRDETVDEVFQQALKVADQLIAKNPEAAYPHTDRADVLEAFALVLGDQGKVGEARRLLNSAMEDLEWVAADELKSEDLASRMESLADDFERLGDQGRSDQIQERADRIDPRPPNADRPKPGRPFGPSRDHHD